MLGASEVLKTRVYTSFVLLGLLLGILWGPVIIGKCALGLIVLVGAWEWSAFAGLRAVLARLMFVFMTLLLGYMTLEGMAHGSVYPLMLLAAVWWLIAAIRILWIHGRVSSGMTLIAGWLTLLPAAAAVVQMYANSPRPDGNDRLLTLMLLVASADIGAYFSGRGFGRTKLAPEVSPGKTWEGVAGGAVLVALVASVLVWGLGMFPPSYLAVAFAVFVASVIGDLTESLFKRGAGLKDSGVILPGHGGVLDRFDGVTAAAPIYVLGLHWIGILP
jgi:phosphatidate cytidylyltransferase